MDDFPMTFTERLDAALYPYRHVKPKLSWSRNLAEDRYEVVIEFSIDSDARSWFKCHIKGVLVGLDDLPDEVIEAVVAEFDQHLFEKGVKVS